MSKDEVIAAIQECAEKLGRCPTLVELNKMRRVSTRIIASRFGSYANAVTAAGLEAKGPGFQVSIDKLFLDWAGVARKLGRLPAVRDYQMYGKYSVRPFRARFGQWHDIAANMRRFAEERSLEAEWNDVIDMTRKHEQGLDETSFTRKWGPRKHNLSIYGAPLIPFSMAHAPTCEQGVIFLFGTMAERLGFVITRIQAAFPDGEALRQLDAERWQRIRIEFEFESRNYLVHGHPVEGCDLIVCWIHNWAECPVEVLELRSVVSEWQKNRA
jgi:HNH endonuclease